MKIGTIVTATDTNPVYIDFIPGFIKAWSILVPEADIVIVLIADSLPQSLHPYSDHIVVYPPIAGIHTAFQAQCIRLLYPREITRDEGVLITDMDMFPMSRCYYVDSVQNIPNDHFVVYRDVCLPDDIPMCYNVAHPSTWTNMFGSEPTDTLLHRWYSGSDYDGEHGGKGWGTDQSVLLHSFNNWDGPKTILNDETTQFQRLDRSCMWQFQDKDNLRKKIQTGVYADYHCLRPYTKHKQMNDFVVGCLTKTVKAFSFCLYGAERPIYYRGMIENVELIDQHFPDWKVYVYYAPDVTEVMITKLQSYPNVVLRATGVVGPVNMIHRSFAIDEPEVEIMLVRDADSRVHWRDRWAIHDFLNHPEYLAHTIRDNAVHAIALMGGLWGMRKGLDINIQDEYEKYKKSLTSEPVYGDDQRFLQRVIYSKLVPKLMVHHSNNYVLPGEHVREFPFEWKEECYCGKVELEHLEPSRFVKFDAMKTTQFTIAKPSELANPLHFLYKK